LAGYSPKVCKMFKYWQWEVLRICQSYWRVTLTSMSKIITMPNLSSSWKVTLNFMFFRIFLKNHLDLILASIWSSDKMRTIFPAWTTFHTLAIIDLS
jgi:hypothetical protein